MAGVKNVLQNGVDCCLDELRNGQRRLGTNAGLDTELFGGGKDGVHLFADAVEELIALPRVLSGAASNRPSLRGRRCQMGKAGLAPPAKSLVFTEA